MNAWRACNVRTVGDINTVHHRRSFSHVISEPDCPVSFTHAAQESETGSHLLELLFVDVEAPAEREGGAM